MGNAADERIVDVHQVPALDRRSRAGRPQGAAEDGIRVLIDLLAPIGHHRRQGDDSRALVENPSSGSIRGGDLLEHPVGAAVVGAEPAEGLRHPHPEQARVLHCGHRGHRELAVQLALG